ncbi:site-specific integrase [Pseudomonas sp. W03]|uniref:site-specific integrase n=1 Tax=Pseudomonas sp. W03 TaxID=3090666 RepID=UPI003A4E128B
MYDSLERYRQAGIRPNTQRSYRSAVEHFEMEWGGVLPATSDSIARYLADYGDSLSSNTLRLRLAALAQWHLNQGFNDPTKSPLVRQVLRGIRALHPRLEKQARPLQVTELEVCVNWLQSDLLSINYQEEPGRYLRDIRDRALLLIGFWRAFRSDDLCNVRVENIMVARGEGMQVFIGSGKSDRENIGATYRTPALVRLCPVQAYIEWVELANLKEGAVFRPIDRWGHVGDKSMHPNSIIPLLRSVFYRAGLDASLYSSHSLRRGFATWATSAGWDLKSLMSYVGWRDPKSAMRYIDSGGDFVGFL